MASLEEENRQVLALVQALLGAVSPNFRAVSLRCEGGGIRLTFLLERDLPEDREEIEDIEFELAALQSGPVGITSDVVISDRPLTETPIPGRMVHLRRESAGQDDD